MFYMHLLGTFGVSWLHYKKQVIKRKKEPEFVGGPFYWTKNKRQAFANHCVFLKSKREGQVEAAEMRAWF